MWQAGATSTAGAVRLAATNTSQNQNPSASTERPVPLDSDVMDVDFGVAARIRDFCRSCPTHGKEKSKLRQMMGRNPGDGMDDLDKELVDLENVHVFYFERSSSGHIAKISTRDPGRETSKMYMNKNISWLRELKKELGTQCHGGRFLVWEMGASDDTMCRRKVDGKNSKQHWMEEKQEEMICWLKKKLEDRNCVDMD